MRSLFGLTAVRFNLIKRNSRIIVLIFTVARINVRKKSFRKQ